MASRPYKHWKLSSRPLDGTLTVVEREMLEAHVQSRLNVFRLMEGVFSKKNIKVGRIPSRSFVAHMANLQLGDDEDLASQDAALSNGFAHLSFAFAVVISQVSVYVSISSLQGSQHRLFDAARSIRLGIGLKGACPMGKAASGYIASLGRITLSSRLEYKM